jgi:hypothetical protein
MPGPATTKEGTTTMTSTEDQDQVTGLALILRDIRARKRRIARSIYCSGSTQWWERATEDNGPPTCRYCHQTPAEMGAAMMPKLHSNSVRVYLGTPPAHLKPDADTTEENRQTLAEVKKVRAGLRRRIRAAERAARELHEASEGRLSLTPTLHGRPASWEQAQQEASQAGEDLLRGYPYALGQHPVGWSL